jgi:alcohol dehydrogenase
MSEQFTINSPNRIIIGRGSLGKLSEEVTRLCGSNILVVTDRGIVNAGLLSKLTDHLAGNGLSYKVFQDVVPDPTISCINTCHQFYQAHLFNLIVGFGGGSSLDVAKAVSILGGNDEPIDRLCGYELVRKPGIPKILIPTTAGTGSEVTNVLVLNDEATHIKRGVTSRYVLPDSALVDPELTMTLPVSVTAETGFDALAHAIEAFLSKESNPFTDALSLQAIRKVFVNLPRAVENGADYRARHEMSVAATFSGLAFGSATIIAAHALSYPVASLCRLSHGKSLAVVLPHVIEHSIQGCLEKARTILMTLGIDSTGCKEEELGSILVQQLKNLLNTIGLSYRLRDHYSGGVDVERLVAEGMKFSRLFQYNPTDLSQSDVAKIYAKSLEG